jgi:hypothetical protein
VRRKILAVLLSLFAAAPPARAQDVGELIDVLTSENAKGYVGPLARGLGHALTAGFVSSADPHAMLGFSLGIRAVGGLFSGQDETFAVVPPGNVTFTHPVLGTRTYQNPYRVSTPNGRSPTLAGEGPGARLMPQGQYRTDLVTAGRNPDAAPYTIALLEGEDFPAAPFAVIDGALGIGFGTQLMARVIPTVDVGEMVGVDEIGDVSAFGVGVMHNLTQWLPVPTPFWDVSVVVGLQKVEAGDYLKASGNTLGVVASAGVGPLSAYAHASTYGSDLDFDYTVENPDGSPDLPPDGTQVAFEEEVGRTQRLALGVQFDLVLMKLSAEYGMGDYETISARVAFGLR